MNLEINKTELKRVFFQHDVQWTNLDKLINKINKLFSDVIYTEIKLNYNKIMINISSSMQDHFVKNAKENLIDFITKIFGETFSSLFDIKIVTFFESSN